MEKLKQLSLKPEEILIAGDRLHTDINMANNLGSYSLLVLSGATKRDEVQNSDIQPDFVLPSIADLS